VKPRLRRGARYWPPRHPADQLAQFLRDRRPTARWDPAFPAVPQDLHAPRSPNPDVYGRRERSCERNPYWADCTTSTRLGPRASRCTSPRPATGLFSSGCPIPPLVTRPLAVRMARVPRQLRPAPRRVTLLPHHTRTRRTSKRSGSGRRGCGTSWARCSGTPSSLAGGRASRDAAPGPRCAGICSPQRRLRIPRVR
jgi:hypothetical protein